MLAVLLGYCCEAQDASALSYSTATCNYSLSAKNAWSSTCNPAATSEIKKLSFAALFQNHFLIKDISTQYIGVAFRIGKLICAGASFFRFGNNLYSKNKLATTLALQCNEKLSAGIQLHAQYIHQSEARNKWNAFPELGVCYKIKEKMILSASLKNFISGIHTSETANDEKQMLRLGLSYYFDKKTRTHFQCIFDNGKYPVIAAAIDYQFNDKLYFGFNISSSTEPFHFGIGYRLQKVKINIDFAYHQQLGFSPMSSFSL